MSISGMHRRPFEGRHLVIIVYQKTLDFDLRVHHTLLKGLNGLVFVIFKIKILHEKL